MTGMLRRAPCWARSGWTSAQVCCSCLDSGSRSCHRGKKRALVAVEHSILVAVWHILTRDTPYQDLGADHFINRIRKSRQTHRLVGQLAQLGYDVFLEPRKADQARIFRADRGWLIISSATKARLI